MMRPPAKMQREWYDRLKAEGFDDIEYADGSLRVACRENRGIDPLEYESTVEYYSRAAEFLDTWEWPSPVHREVWRMHSEGATLREIGSAHGRSVEWARLRVAASREAMVAWSRLGSPAIEDPCRTPGRRRRQRRPWRREVGKQTVIPF